MTIRIRQEEVVGQPMDYEHISVVMLSGIEKGIQAITSAKDSPIWSWAGRALDGSEAEVMANADGVAVVRSSGDEGNTNIEKWIIVTSGQEGTKVYRLVENQGREGFGAVSFGSLSDCDELGRIKTAVEGAQYEIVGAQSLAEL